MPDLDITNTQCNNNIKSLKHHQIDSRAHSSERCLSGSCYKFCFDIKKTLKTTTQLWFYHEITNSPCFKCLSNNKYSELLSTNRFSTKLTMLPWYFKYTSLPISDMYPIRIRVQYVYNLYMILQMAYLIFYNRLTPDKVFDASQKKTPE